MLKFIVLSDLHLVPEGQTSHGLDTYVRLQRGIAAINERHPDCDFIVMAGDLVDRGFEDDRESYGRLKELVALSKSPVHLTIGNHDSRQFFVETFGEDTRAETGCIDKVIDAKGHRVIVLDSVVEGEHTHGGHLSDAQLDWLKVQLDAASEKPVVVILHHHANPLHTMVDRIILENGADFAEVLKSHGDIRQIIAGHVHYTSTGIWHGLPFTTLAGSHYNVTVPLKPDQKTDRLWGPAQMAVVLGDAEQTLVHFENYMDGNAVLS